MIAMAAALVVTAMAPSPEPSRDVLVLVSRLERVQNEARFVGVEAAYALQTVHYRQGELSKALFVDGWPQARFPDNPVSL